MNNSFNIIKNKYHSMDVVKKAVIWFTFCNIFQKGIATLTIPIFTRILTTEEYGIYSLYLSWFNIIVIFSSLNLQYASFNNAMIKYRNNRIEYVASMQSIIIVLTSIIGIICFCFIDQVSNILDLSQVLILALVIDLIFEPMIEIWSAKQRFEYKYKKVVIVTCLKSFLNPFLGIIVVIFNNCYRVELRIGALVFVDMFIAIPIIISTYIKSKKICVRSYAMYAIKFNIPMIPHYISGIILNQSDRIMIEKYVSFSKAGIYSIAYSIATLVQLVINSIINAITPWIYEKLENCEYDEIYVNTKKYFSIVAFLILIILIIAPELTLIFAGEKYYEAIYIIPSVAVGIYFFFIANFYTIFELYYENKVCTFLASSGAALINLFLNWIFIPKLGYLVAGYTTLFGYILLAVFHILAYMHLRRKNNIDKKVFNTQFALRIMSLLIVTMIVICLLYKYIIIRYSLLVILLFLLYLFKDKIINLVKKDYNL